MTNSILFSKRSLNSYPLFIQSYAEIKKAAAKANKDLGCITEEAAGKIISCCDKLKENPQSKIFETQAWCIDGVDFNSLFNSFISAETGVQVDLVNKNQIANDVLQTAQNLTVLNYLDVHMIGVETLIRALREKSIEFQDTLHIGRSHMQESLPVTWGGVFGAMALSIQKAFEEINNVREVFLEVNLGATPIDQFAVCVPGFSPLVIDYLRRYSHFELRKPKIDFSDQPNTYYIASIEGSDKFVRLLSFLRLVAINIARISNDLYLYSSGPRCGISELSLPAIAPGSTIMPGKINPSMPELMLQVFHQTMSVDQMACFSYIEEDIDLEPTNNPVFFDALEIIEVIGRGSAKFVEKCVQGIFLKPFENSEHLRNSASLIAIVKHIFGNKTASQVVEYCLDKKVSVSDALIELGFANSDNVSTILGLEKFKNPQEVKAFLAENGYKD